jgi:hypothetical protein
VLGIGFLHGSYGDIEQTQVEPGQNRGVSVGSFNANDNSVNLAFAKPVLQNLSTGLNLKLFRQNIGDDRGQGYALDAGSVYRIANSPVTLGLALRNMGPAYHFGSSKMNLPSTINLGSSSTLFFDSLVGFLDAEKGQNSNWILRFGVELNVAQTVYLRAGKNGMSASKGFYAFGGGLKFKNYALDYGFDPTDVLGQAHSFSISIFFL